jgi:hypothetical protein
VLDFGQRRTPTLSISFNLKLDFPKGGNVNTWASNTIRRMAELKEESHQTFVRHKLLEEQAATLYQSLRNAARDGVAEIAAASPGFPKAQFQEPTSRSFRVATVDRSPAVQVLVTFTGTQLAFEGDVFTNHSTPRTPISGTVVLSLDRFNNIQACSTKGDALNGVDAILDYMLGPVYYS